MLPSHPAHPPSQVSDHVVARAGDPDRCSMKWKQPRFINRVRRGVGGTKESQLLHAVFTADSFKPALYSSPSPGSLSVMLLYLA